jgi:hypothetical protein
MDELPLVPIAAAVVVVLVGPVRRRAIAAAAALGRTGATLVVASARGAGDVARAAVTGSLPGVPADPS